ncbi:cupin domain-containing protein [Actinoplanes sp. TRM 88003]|uniref:Cupin domain-containing protein n=1 Tax=Paractinoplanes aksuensis TaxID=2939490 RepID=A0ABT1DW06_9ACTN|nr:AraC family transcriptional regulator [Actinoplanes aksuensis]MCO8275039.1 cupin domain-containing protein [Actinoplanes aksuensis]
MFVPQTTPDVLGSVLREISFASAAYRWIEMGTPFRLVFNRPGLRGVHLITAGACDLVLPSSAATPLTGGAARPLTDSPTTPLPGGLANPLLGGSATPMTGGVTPSPGRSAAPPASDSVTPPPTGSEAPPAGSSVIPLTAGDTVILPRGDDHELRSGRAATAISGFEMAARTPGARLRGGGPQVAVTIVCGAFIAGDPDHPALRGLPPVLFVPGTDGRPPAWLAPYVEVLRQEAFDAGPGSDIVMARLSDALVTRVLREHGPLTDHPGWLAGLADPHLAAALGALHTDPARPWTLASLAAVAGLSRTAFTGRFATTVGEPPMRYLQSLRLHQARRLLRDERLTVAAVAARVGYTSGVAFAATFRRVLGIPPAEWRRRATDCATDRCAHEPGWAPRPPTASCRTAG